MRRGKSGFSLVELMVVVSIIAILMALGSVSYTTAQKKARDASRRGDMRSIQNAMEQYYVANGGYPASCAGLEDPEFLPGGVPTDPKPSLSYTCTSDTDTYCACAEMENETGNSGANCAFGSGTDHFCVVNQQ